MKHAKPTYILQTSQHWAKGTTIHEAAKALLKVGGYKSDKVIIHQVLNDPNPYINDWGSICYGGAAAPDAVLLKWICAGTLGNILSANKDRR